MYSDKALLPPFVEISFSTSALHDYSSLLTVAPIWAKVQEDLVFKAEK